MKFPGRVLTAAKDATVTDHTYDRDGEIVGSTTRTVPAQQCWVLNLDGKRYWIESDKSAQLVRATEHNARDDETDMTGFLSKINPQTGDFKYGPKRITRDAANRIIAFAMADR